MNVTQCVGVILRRLELEPHLRALERPRGREGSGLVRIALDVDLGAEGEGEAERLVRRALAQHRVGEVLFPPAAVLGRVRPRALRALDRFGSR